MSDTIELTERQRKRFETIRAECKEADPDLPEPTDEQLVSSLLDTWDAVGDGLYSDGGNNTSDRYCYGCGAEDGLEPSIVDGKVQMLCPTCDTDREHSFVDVINAFERNFRYPDDIHFDPEFWLKHAHQQVEEAEESAAEGDTEHMVVELGDTILVAWRAMQIFGDRPPEEIISDRIDLNLDEKGADAIMEKYTEWWRSVHENGEWNWRELHPDKTRNGAKEEQ